MMASYLRNLFGGGSSGRSKSSSSPSKSSKAHGRSQSFGVPPVTVYTPMPGTKASSRSASSRKVHRANSYTATAAMNPSPLRYQSQDSRRSFDSIRPGTATSSQSAPIYRTSSRTHHDGRYPHFAASSGYATSSSSRSNSSSSIYPVSVHASHPTFPHSPLAPNHGQAASQTDRRPPLKQNHTWPNNVESAAGSAASYPTRARTREVPLCMHPLLAYTRRHSAPISFDVAFTPSARSVLDKTIHAPVPAVTLAQPATEPPIPASSRLVLRSEKFPWLVVVGPVGSTPTFFLGSGKSSRAKSSAALTNLDVLYAVHTTLMTRITREEWESLGNGSKAQRKVAAAYEKRCTRMGGGWEGGVRRIDWLHSKTHLVGIEADKNSAAGGKVGKLVFGRG